MALNSNHKRHRAKMKRSRRREHHLKQLHSTQVGLPPELMILESRVLLSGDAFCGDEHGHANVDHGPECSCGSCQNLLRVHVDALWAPDTPQEVVDAWHAEFGDPHHDDLGEPHAFQFNDNNRWDDTTTNGNGLDQGDPTILTWSIVPDGTPINGFNGEPSAPSDLQARLDQIYGNINVWLPLIEQSLNSWSEVSGVTYVYEPNDDGASFGFFDGQAGVRGDVRIGGHRIDGNSGVLAYNFFPEVGDMVIDTADSFYNNTGGNSLRLRNVVAHEAGHGLGIGHVEPVNGTKLMEPFINLSFDGPQHDDILAANRGYGDRLENNDTAGTATSLGTLSNQSVFVDTISIDDNADVDFFSFTTTSESLIDLTLDPFGFVYQQGPQGGSTSTFDSQAQSDLAVSILDTNGVTVLATSNSGGLGEGETITGLNLGSPGTYFLRVTGNANAVQMYEFDLTVTNNAGGNNSPNAVDDAYVVTEDSSLSVNAAAGVLDNDSDTDGDSLTASLISGPSNAAAFQLNADGSFDYTPQADFFGIDTWTYQVNDGRGGTDQGTVTITVQPTNDAPVGVDDQYIIDENTTLSVDVASGVLADDNDVDGDPLSVTLLNGPTNAQTFQLNADGSFTYTPIADFTGDDGFSYTVNDGNGGSDTATVTISVDEAGSNTSQFIDFNETPILSYGTASQDRFGDVVILDGGATLYMTGNLWKKIEINYTITPDTIVEFDFRSDRQGEIHAIGFDNDDQIDASSAFQIHGTQPWATHQEFYNYATPGEYQHYVIPVGQFYTGTFSHLYFTLDHDRGTKDGDSFFRNVIVYEEGAVLNDPPIATDDAATVDEDAAATLIDVLANDSDPTGDPLTIVDVSVTSAGGTVNIVDGQLEYTPASNFNGTETFTYTIDDGRGGNDTATVTVTVNSVNDAPAATDDAFTVDEDTSDNVFDVLANDSDDDGDTLTISDVSAGSAGGTIEIVGSNLHYTPVTDFFGTETFTYTIDDGTGGNDSTDSATVTVTVNHVNNPPTANDDAITVDEDAGATLIDVLANDSDPDANNTLSITGVSAGSAGGSITIVSDQLQYTPMSNFNGTETFTYDINDGEDGNASATVTVTVNPVNDDPTAGDDAFAVNENTSNNVLQVLANDADIDGDTLIITSVGATSAGGTANIVGNTLQYTPLTDFEGVETFTYTIGDGNGGSATANVSVTVNPVNELPTAIDDAVIVDEDSGVTTIDVLSNDDDPDGDPLTIVDVSVTSAGGTVNIVDGQLEYTPASNFNGTETFTYTIDDGRGGNDTATVTVTVNSVNDAPAATDDAFTVDEDTSDNVFDVLANDSDDDGDTLTISDVSAGSAGGTIEIVGSNLHYTPVTDFFGTETFTYTIDDGTGGNDSTDSATVTVTVNHVNNPPTANDDAITVDEDAGATLIDVLANDSDPDANNTLSITGVSAGSAGGSITIVSDQLQYTPTSNFNGTETFTYDINDGEDGNASATVTVTVNPVNDDPTAGDDAYDIDANNPLTTNAANGVLANDGDVDGDGLTASLVSGPTHADAFQLNADGSFSYTPTVDFTGDDSFEYAVSDGNGGQAVATATITVNDVQFIDFNETPILSYGTASQDRFGDVVILDGGATLYMTGNLWKKIEINYTITPDTIVEFDFRSDRQGEIHAIGFDNDDQIDASSAFQIHGTQPWATHQEFYNYATPGEYQHYVIPVGQFYTGTFSHLYFTLDHDRGTKDGDSFFRNVKVYENVAAVQSVEQLLAGAAAQDQQGSVFSNSGPSRSLNPAAQLNPKNAAVWSIQSLLADAIHELRRYSDR